MTDNEKYGARARDQRIECPLTTTAKEELEDIVQSCLEAISEQSKFEKSLAADFKAMERTIKELEGRRGNEAVTIEQGQAIANLLRQAIAGNQLNAQGTHVLMLFVLKLSLLALQDKGMDVESLDRAQKELESWFEQWNAARKDWDDYAG